MHDLIQKEGLASDQDNGGYLSKSPVGSVLATQLSFTRLILMGALVATVALFVKNPFASSKQVTGIPKEFICELQCWRWKVKSPLGNKDVDLKNIPKDEKLASVRIVRQIDTVNFGSAQIGDTELRFMIEPDPIPDERDGKVKDLQVFLSLHNLSSSDDVEWTVNSAGGRVSLEPAKLGKREYIGGSMHGKTRQASAFFVIIEDAKILIKAIEDEEQHREE